MPQSPPQKPWHRQPLVWMLIAIPFSAVIMGVIMITLAVNTDDGLVVDDYYKYGKEINLVVARDRAAEEKGIHGSFAVNPENLSIQLTLMAEKTEETLPETVELKLIHATRAGFDQNIALNYSAPEGVYKGALQRQLAAGNWTLQLSGTDWRVIGRMRAPQQVSSNLRPNI